MSAEIYDKLLVDASELWTKAKWFELLIGREDIHTPEGSPEDNK